jgi:hypothetical protein
LPGNNEKFLSTPQTQNIEGIKNIFRRKYHIDSDMTKEEKKAFVEEIETRCTDIPSPAEEPKPSKKLA